MQLCQISLFIPMIISMSLAMEGLKSRPKRDQLLPMGHREAFSESAIAFQPYSKYWVPEIPLEKQRTTYKTTTTTPVASTTLSVAFNPPVPVSKNIIMTPPRILPVSPIPTKSASASARITKRKKKPNSSTARISRFAGPVVTRVPLTERDYAKTREDSVSFEIHKFVFGANPVRLSPVRTDPLLLYPAAPVSEKSSIEKEAIRMQPVQSPVTSTVIRPVAPPVIHEIKTPPPRTPSVTPPNFFPVGTTVPQHPPLTLAPPVVTRVPLSASTLVNTVPQPPIPSFAPPVLTRVPLSLPLPSTPSNITTRNATRISDDQNGGRWVTRLCGYPAICDFDQCVSLNITSDPLFNCEVPGAAAAFGLAAILMGLGIVLGNLLMPIVVWKQPDMRNRHNYIKGETITCYSVIIRKVILFCNLRRGQTSF